VLLYEYKHTVGPLRFHFSIAFAFACISRVLPIIPSLTGFSTQKPFDMNEQEYANQSYGEHYGVNKDAKGGVLHMEGLPSPPSSKGMEAPELVRMMSPEQRAIAEKKLKRKIDIRLLPMLILMYSMLLRGGTALELD